MKNDPEYYNRFNRIVPHFDSFDLSDEDKYRLARLVVANLTGTGKLPTTRAELLSMQKVADVHPCRAIGSTLLHNSGLDYHLSGTAYGPFANEVELGDGIMEMLEQTEPFRYSDEVIQLPFGDGHMLEDDGIMIRAIS